MYFWHKNQPGAMHPKCSIYIIHLLDRTETNIIFIWSGIKVILGEAKPSPNITLPDQINMILGEVLSNKCFIIPVHPGRCAHPVHRTFY